MTIRLRHKNLPAKTNLGHVYNGWLTEKEREEARRMAKDPNVTEEEAVRHLKRLEQRVNARYQGWLMFQ